MSAVLKLRGGNGKPPSAVCPCCVLAFVMLPVARSLSRAWGFEKEPRQVMTLKPPSSPLGLPSPSCPLSPLPPHTSTPTFSSSLHSVPLVFFHVFPVVHLLNDYNRASLQFLLPVGVCCASLNLVLRIGGKSWTDDCRRQRKSQRFCCSNRQ